MNGQPLGDRRARRVFPDILHRSGKAAALMRAEGVYRLAGKIITFKERVHRHRHRAPIVGVAEVNLVVGVQIFRQVQNLRARLFLQVW